jgi:carbon-monoxide dehydrogenase medium subunit
MKMTTPPDSVPYFTPETISEALELINNKSNLSFISGATDIMVNRQQGNFESDGLVDLTNIIELTTSSPDGDEYKIGAAVKLSEIIANPYINEYFQVIIEAAKSVATPLIRNQATI